VTATARAKARSGRNVLLWCAAIVGISIVLAVLAPRNTDNYLDPAGHGPNGVAALVEVLRDHGVQVELVDTVAGLSAALAGSAGPAQTTVAIGDSRLLTARGAEAVTRAINGAGRLVLLDGAPAVLDVIDPDVQVFAAGGRGWDEFAAECSDSVVRDGATVGRFDLRLIADGGATSCFPLPRTAGIDHGALLVTVPVHEGLPQTYAVGFGGALTNRYVTDAGHAALGLRLLGAHPRLIFYTPSITDQRAVDGAQEEGPDLPAWLMPGLVLIGLAVLTLAVVSGRRLGRLVPEPLPVVVKASETTHSRAELYRAAQDRARTADVLRQGTLGRLRSRLRLDTSATPDAVVAAVAAHGIPLEAARAALDGPPPDTDAALVRLATDLATLEEKVTPR